MTGELLFVNKQRELFPNVTRSPKEARRQALKYVIDTFERLIDEALNQHETFVYEAHFTNNATWDAPRRFKTAGYQIHLMFFGLANPDLSQLRVTDRIADGGHFVDRQTLEANFAGNLQMLNLHFRFIGHLTIVDTSGMQHTTVATLQAGKIVSVIPISELPDWFTQYLPAITALIT